ncbi:YcfF/hinT protein: a purine nucleoside phosphoramidase [Klebsiella pneumoniae]|nr:YcfF/hinT protein: a purine nucleoside phosphoramidase [Klebsiella pneumoniae]
MAEETIFSKIIRREIPSDIVYQDELVTAFSRHLPAGAHPYSDCPECSDSYRK